MRWATVVSAAIRDERQLTRERPTVPLSEDGRNIPMIVAALAEIY